MRERERERVRLRGRKLNKRKLGNTGAEFSLTSRLSEGKNSTEGTHRIYKIYTTNMARAVRTSQKITYNHPQHTSLRAQQTHHIRLST